MWFGHSPPFQGGVAATIKQNVAKPPYSGADGHERSECKRDSAQPVTVVKNEWRSAPLKIGGFAAFIRWLRVVCNHPARLRGLPSLKRGMVFISAMPCRSQTGISHR